MCECIYVSCVTSTKSQCRLAHCSFQLAVNMVTWNLHCRNHGGSNWLINNYSSSSLPFETRVDSLYGLSLSSVSLERQTVSVLQCTSGSFCLLSRALKLASFKICLQPVSLKAMMHNKICNRLKQMM